MVSAYRKKLRVKECRGWIAYGSTYFDKDGTRTFKEYWAHNHTEERAAFKSYIEWAYQVWLANPTMHIYHYGHYEIDVCRR
jgi:predicted RecB family nuclease